MAGEFVELEPAQALRLIDAIATIVAVSYADDGSRRTMAEDRRRTQICLEMYRMMRREFHWSLPRIIDDLPYALRHKLDGTPWSPSQRACWGERLSG